MPTDPTWRDLPSPATPQDTIRLADAIAQSLRGPVDADAVDRAAAAADQLADAVLTHRLIWLRPAITTAAAWVAGVQVQDLAIRMPTWCDPITVRAGVMPGSLAAVVAGRHELAGDFDRRGRDIERAMRDLVAAVQARRDGDALAALLDAAERAMRFLVDDRQRLPQPVVEALGEAGDRQQQAHALLLFLEQALSAVGDVIVQARVDRGWPAVVKVAGASGNCYAQALASLLRRMANSSIGAAPTIEDPDQVLCELRAELVAAQLPSETTSSDRATPLQGQGRARPTLRPVIRRTSKGMGVEWMNPAVPAAESAATVTPPAEPTQQPPTIPAISVELRALTVLRSDGYMSKSALAKRVGCDRRTLYKSKAVLMMHRQLQNERQRSIRRGSKSRDGTIEAYDQ
jgi:hypothetical protein